MLYHRKNTSRFLETEVSPITQRNVTSRRGGRGAPESVTSRRLSCEVSRFPISQPVV